MGRSHIPIKNVFNTTCFISLSHSASPILSSTAQKDPNHSTELYLGLQNTLTLCMSPKLAGMGAPNVIAYYKVTILSQTRPWCTLALGLPWTHIESAAAKADLKLLLGATWLQQTSPLQFLDTVKATHNV